MRDNDLGDRIEAIERLTNLFRWERRVHLGVTSISLVMLLVSAGVMMYQRTAGPFELSLMFGSSGLITYSAARLLHMWDQALAVINSAKKGGR